MLQVFSFSASFFSIGGPSFSILEGFSCKSKNIYNPLSNIHQFQLSYILLVQSQLSCRSRCTWYFSREFGFQLHLCQIPLAHLAPTLGSICGFSGKASWIYCTLIMSDQITFLSYHFKFPVNNCKLCYLKKSMCRFGSSDPGWVIIPAIEVSRTTC